MRSAAEPAVTIARTVRAPARAWIAFTTILTLGVFLQAVTAGRILTGDDWARNVHRSAAGLLFIAAVVGGVVALVRLRDRTGGRRLGLMLVVIGVGLFVQHGLGTAAADGKDTLWIHVPLGVAFVALMMRLNIARPQYRGTGVSPAERVGTGNNAAAVADGLASRVITATTAIKSFVFGGRTAEIEAATSSISPARSASQTHGNRTATDGGARSPCPGPSSTCSAESMISTGRDTSRLEPPVS